MAFCDSGLRPLPCWSNPRTNHGQTVVLREQMFTHLGSHRTERVHLIDPGCNDALPHLDQGDQDVGLTAWKYESQGAPVIVLTDEDRLIWRELHARASAASATAATSACVPYGQLGTLVDPDGTWHYPMSRPPFRGLNDALGRVSHYEFEHGRPLLSSLVVTVDTADLEPGSVSSPQRLASRLAILRRSGIGSWPAPSRFGRPVRQSS